ncbi:MAG: hypothetical protein WAP47_09590 [Candidatus Rokuibacteriota bacterium]
MAIWFETFRPAAGKAVITLLSFGLDDVARGYFRPKGVYPRKCMGRRARPRSAVGIPELGEEIGKRLPAADNVKSRSFGATEKNLWLVDGLFQRVLFWVMVADIVTDFTYDWASGIYKATRCATAEKGNFLVTGMKLVTSGGAPFGWQMADPGTVEQARHVFYVPAGPWQVSLASPGPYHVTATWTVKCGLFESAIFHLRLTTEPPEHLVEELVSLGPGESVTKTLSLGGVIGRATTFPEQPAAGMAATATLDAFNVMAG